MVKFGVALGARLPEVNFSRHSVSIIVILVSSLCLQKIKPCEGIMEEECTVASWVIGAGLRGVFPMPDSIGCGVGVGWV